MRQQKLKFAFLKKNLSAASHPVSGVHLVTKMALLNLMQPVQSSAALCSIWYIVQYNTPYTISTIRTSSSTSSVQSTDIGGTMYCVLCDMRMDMDMESSEDRKPGKLK